MAVSSVKEPMIFSPDEFQLVLDCGNANGFNVPIYQRLFAWRKKEITKLLKDIHLVLKKDPKKEYFIGNITLNYNNNSGRYDIIDGQQRITTLWLVALVLQSEFECSEWQNFLYNGTGITLSFIAREDDNNFLKYLYEKRQYKKTEIAENEDINPMMIDAIDCIREFLKNEVKINIPGYSAYVFKSVKMAAVFLPDNINLNKYFEDMNNRGLQLEPHHVIKARLLQRIDEKYQAGCAKVWDSISQMNQYIEYGLGELKNSREWILNRPEEYFKHLIELTGGESGQTMQGAKNLLGLVDEAIKIDYKPGDNKPIEKESEEKTISIISFSEFLLHCLRIFKKDHSITVDDMKLDETFARMFETSFDAMGYIEFLLRTRILFDHYLIKSNTTNDGTKWEIRKIENVNGELIRKNHLGDIVVQLQSMLYVSTDTSLWLTKFLESLDFGLSSEAKVLDYLEQIDRSIFKEMPQADKLNMGTNTLRYWFFKLDYLLWKHWTLDGAVIPNIEGIDRLEKKIKNFQFRDNRSVEHIQPQNPEKETWDKPSGSEVTLEKIKNSFGNIALISVRSNSSYSNQLPSYKKDDFIKRTKHWGIESLKLLDAYKYKEWTIENMKLHQNEMIELLEKEYK